MKKLNVFVTMLLLVVGGTVFAQEKQVKKCAKYTPEQRMEMKIKHLQNVLCLDDKTTSKFAPLYKEYIQELRSCGAKPEAKQKKADRTDEQILQDMKNRFAAQQKMLDTKEKYFNKFQKILNARQLEKLFAPRHGKMAKHKCCSHQAGLKKCAKKCDKKCKKVCDKKCTKKCSKDKK